MRVPAGGFSEAAPSSWGVAALTSAQAPPNLLLAPAALILMTSWNVLGPCGSLLLHDSRPPNGVKASSQNVFPPAEVRLQVPRDEPRDWQGTGVCRVFSIEIDWHAVARNNTERSPYPFPAFPPVVTSCRTLVQ